MDKLKELCVGNKVQVNGGALFCEWRTAVPLASRCLQLARPSECLPGWCCQTFGYLP